MKNKNNKPLKTSFFLPGALFFFSKLTLGPTKPIIGANPKHGPNFITKAVFPFRWLCSSLTHNFYLSLLITYLIVHPLWALTQDTEPVLKCPNHYAYEVEPNTYIRCEDYDRYWELAPHNQHLTMEYMNGTR